MNIGLSDSLACDLISRFRASVLACGTSASSREIGDYMRAQMVLLQALRGVVPEVIDDMCARIKAADDAAADGDYMLDSADCISILRGTWTGPMNNDQPQPQPPVPVPHDDDLAVDRFAAAMKEKLAAARAKGRGGWEQPTVTAEALSAMLREHVDKGDPRDVANLAMFLYERGEAIAPAPGPHQQLINTLKRTRDGWQHEAEMLRRQLEARNEEIELRVLHQDKDCWYWQGDAEDHPESFGNSMCIVIRGDQLREMVNKANAGPAPELVRAAEKALKAMIAGKRVLKRVGYSLDRGTIGGPFADAVTGLRAALDKTQAAP